MLRHKMHTTNSNKNSQRKQAELAEGSRRHASTSLDTRAPPPAGPSPIPPFPLTTRRSSPPSPPFSATFSEASALVYIYIYNLEICKLC